MVTYLGQTLYQVAFVFLIIWMLEYLIQFWMWETNLGYTDLICPTLPFKASSVKELCVKCLAVHILKYGKYY